ncbi:MAG: hypothetical protein EBV10_02575 [Synechococcaceae bacterium WB6_1A_059]|nr:hypothetical protein [Synechococcaceae bacterium WB6_1A_059]
MKKISLLIVFLILSFTNVYAFSVGNKPVQVIIPFAPGGGVDQTFKHFQKYAESKGVVLVAVYKPGGDGVIGMAEIAQRPKDGLHISIGTAGTIAIQKIKNPNLDVDVVSSIRNSMMVFVSSEKSGINSLADLEKKLKANEKISLAFGAPGQKMLLDQLVENIDNKIVPTMVPYKGGGPVINDLRGNHIDVGVLPLSIVKQHIDSGHLKAIAISSKVKPTDLSKVISLPEKYTSWSNDDSFMFILPKNVSSDVYMFWENFLKEYMQDKNNIEAFTREFTELSVFGKQAAEKSVENVKNQLLKYQ